MKNLYVMDKEILVRMIETLDNELSYLDMRLYETMNYNSMGGAEIDELNNHIQSLQNQLNKAYRDYEEMNKTRIYWKSQALDYKKQLIEAGLMKDMKRKVSKPKPKKEFKINIIKDGEKVNIKDISKKPVRVKEVNQEVYKNAESTDELYRPGNITNTKHEKGHFSPKNGNEVLIGTRLIDGEIFEFSGKKEAIKYLRNLGYTGKFTNLSRAARGSGVYEGSHKAYRHVWKYEEKGE